MNWYFFFAIFEQFPSRFHSLKPVYALNFSLGVIQKSKIDFSKHIEKYRSSYLWERTVNPYVRSMGKGQKCLFAPFISGCVLAMKTIFNMMGDHKNSLVGRQTSPLELNALARYGDRIFEKRERHLPMWSKNVWKRKVNGVSRCVRSKSRPRNPDFPFHFLGSPNGVSRCGRSGRGTVNPDSPFSISSVQSERQIGFTVPPGS